MTIRVPDTDNFSLQDVYDAVKNHSAPTGDLRDCFAKALANYFDAAYDNDSYAPPNSLKRFRNYGPPPGNPTTGSFTLPFPDYSGYRAVGLLIYVSPNGDNLFVLLQVKLPGGDAYQLVRFAMSNFDLSTAQYVSERNVGSPGSFTWKQLIFSDSGDRFSLLNDSHLLYTGNSSKIQTWRLNTNWGIDDVGGYEETSPEPYYGTNQYRFDAMAYSEDGGTLVLYQRYSNMQYLNFYSVTNFAIPTGTINAASRSAYSQSDIGNVVTGLNMFDDSPSPGQTTLGLVTAGGDFALIKVRIDESPWNSYYSYSTVFTLTPYDGYWGSYTQDNMGYTYVLEHNENASQPLKPRIYLRVH